MSIYTEKGYKNREDYHKQLAEEHDIEYDTVQQVAYLLGENEDFDGLVTSLQDIENTDRL
jgi:hypothetical protein